MNRQVIAEFSTVGDAAAAEALSELFVQGDKFFIQHPANTEQPYDIDHLAAIGSSYIGGDGQVEFTYALHPMLDRPYAATQAFLEAYEARLVPEHKQARNAGEALGRKGHSGLEYWGKTVIDYVQKAGLRTIGAYALFANQNNSGYVGSPIVAVKVVKEMPLQGRKKLMEQELRSPESTKRELAIVALLAGGNPAEVERVQQDILHNRNQENFAIFVAALHMPGMTALRRAVGQHPTVGDFATMPRTARRELIRAEQKQARKNS